MLRCITNCYALVFVLRYGTLGSSTALYPNRFRVCWSVEKVEHKTHECLCSAFFKSCYNTALLVTGNSDILVLFWGVLVTPLFLFVFRLALLVLVQHCIVFLYVSLEKAKHNTREYLCSAFFKSFLCFLVGHCIHMLVLALTCKVGAKSLALAQPCVFTL